jgi:hypothetical protein
MTRRQTYQERKAARQRAEDAALAVLARGPVEPPATGLAWVTWLLETAPWQFARTMADNPHWYTLRRRWQNDSDFVYVVKSIRAWGSVERFPDPEKGWPYIALDVEGYHYWTMGPGVRRGPTATGPRTRCSSTASRWTDTSGPGRLGAPGPFPTAYQDCT